MKAGRILESPVTYTNIYGSEDFDSRKGNTWLFYPEEEEKAGEGCISGRRSEAWKTRSLRFMLRLKVIRSYERENRWQWSRTEARSMILARIWLSSFELRVKGTCGQKLRLQCVRKTGKWESPLPSYDKFLVWRDTFRGETECFDQSLPISRAAM